MMMASSRPHDNTLFVPQTRNKYNCLADAVGFSDRYPVSDEEVEKVEKILENELNKLSLDEREEILFDIHGIPQTRDEDPPTIETYLKDLEEAISNIRNKTAYDLAKYLNEDYVNNPSFRLMFLRSECFDVKAAAEKMVLHFHIKQELFGSGEVLARDVRLSDLNEEDIEVLKTGYIQMLPFRDAAGRSIMCFPNNSPPTDIGQMCRTNWYFFSTILKDEDTQKKGYVALAFNLSEDADTEDLVMLKKMTEIHKGIPERINALHYCYDLAALRPIVAGLELHINNDQVRNRFRSHFGSIDDIMFELQTCGIPTNDIKVNKDGSVCNKQHLEWLRIREKRESAESASDEIIVPRKFDVLFGRGRIAKEHTGNLRAIHLVEMYREEYEEANKYQKTEIAERIVSIIHDSHGRFLRWEGDDGWVEVEHDIAREKVSHFFRRTRLKSKKSSPKPSQDAENQTSKPKSGSQKPKRRSSAEMKRRNSDESNLDSPSSKRSVTSSDKTPLVPNLDGKSSKQSWKNPENTSVAHKRVFPKEAV